MTARDHGATKFETVRYEPKGPICHIILNRPEKLNAANDQLVEEVNDALFEFDADPDAAGRDPQRAPAAPSAPAPTCSSASSARARSSSGWAGRPGGARGRTGSATPSTGSR